MKILHCCLSEHYIDNYNYQENILTRINKIDGHDVKIIASTEIYNEKVKIVYTKPQKYINSDGIEVIRIDYKRYLPNIIMKKFRQYKNLYYLIEEFSPDVIMFHGMCTYDLLTVAKYKKNNPNVKLYTDSHEDKYNSARNFLSRYILHKFFYKSIIRRSSKYIDKIFYITYEAKIFLEKLYKVNKGKLEYMPLGGNVLSKSEITDYRNKIRKKHNINSNNFLFIHSGRLDDKLKRTDELIKAFKKVNDDHFRLFLIGSMNSETLKELKPIFETDSRINYIGWKSGDELIEYLCAGDLYIQPGTQSCTMQTALCCGNAVAVYPYDSHKYLLKDNAIYIKTFDDMVKLFEKISNDKTFIDEKKSHCYEVANNLLDYKKIASTLYK